MADDPSRINSSVLGGPRPVNCMAPGHEVRLSGGVADRGCDFLGSFSWLRNDVEKDLGVPQLGFLCGAPKMPTSNLESMLVRYQLWKVALAIPCIETLDQSFKSIQRYPSQWQSLGITPAFRFLAFRFLVWGLWLRI